MESERRLHLLSPLFAVATQVRSILLPGILALFAAEKSGFNWEAWGLLAMVPYTLHSLLHYATYRYRFEDARLVIRTGYLFKNERQIPYHRVQSVDAVQNVFHRLARVIEVRLQTGGGSEPEARIRVLSAAAYEELRGRVALANAGLVSAAERSFAEPATPPSAASPAGEELVRIPDRELALHGLIHGRGSVVFAVMFGVAWELGLFQRWGQAKPELGQGARGLARSTVRRGLQAFFGDGPWPWRELGFLLLALLGLLILLRLFSVGMALIRWGGFRVTIAGDDLRVDHGRFTRVHQGLPRRRIQTLHVQSSLLQRLLGRASVRVETAVGHTPGEQDQGETGAWLAPILRQEQVSALITLVWPAHAPQGADWQPVAPRAAARLRKKKLIVAVVVSGLLAFAIEWWALLALAALAAWAHFSARKEVAHLGWALHGEALWVRRGWWRRQLSVVPLAKLQTAATHESPFDRRARMARVHVDAAGAGLLAAGLDIPYLARDKAHELRATLARQAARSELAW
jgi:putative membrane protein